MLLRLLQMFSLGSALGLGVLGINSELPLFNPWFIGFLILAIILLVLRVLSWRSQKKQSQATVDAGTPRAARVLARQRTGYMTGEKPRVEFDLLVDRPGQRPFHTKMYELIDVLDFHRYKVGKIIMVVQLNPEYGDVVLAEDRQAPAASGSMADDGAGDHAEVLPRLTNTSQWQGFLSGVFEVLALAVGLFGAPYVLYPESIEYLFEGLSKI